MRRHCLFTRLLVVVLVLGSIAGTSAPVAANNGVSVQLAMMLDGSGSISDFNWTIMVTGLHDAVENPECVPHDGSVELTVIQFGQTWAQLEVGPVVITSGNAASVANQIQAISQLKGYTPIACAIHLAADTLVASANFDPSLKQALNLVTDGVPNVCCTGPGYTGSYCGYDDGEVSAVAARGYALTTLQMTDPSDEFDAEAIGVEPDVNWLRDSIVWPQPGYDSWPPPGPGWVRVVENFEEFAATICEKFEVIIPTAAKTFNLTITGCEPEDVVYTVSLAGGAYQTMTGTPPSYTFTGLTVGQTYSYSIKADDTEILSGTTGSLVEGTNVNNLSYHWPCASKTFNLIITGCEPEDVVYKVSLAGGAYQTMTGSPPSYTFTSLIVGQTYSYSIKAIGTEILSGTTGYLVEGTNVNNLSYQWPCAAKTFNLTITGCEPEGMGYKVSLAGGAYQTMTGTPPSYTFTGLIVGQTYSYAIKADDTEILSGTTGSLVEGTNVNNLSYQWPCAAKTFNLTITGCEPEGMGYKVSLAGGAYQTMTGTPPSYTFSGLIVGQTYSYSIKADDTEILSGTTGSLVEGTNVNNLSYQWPCASITIKKQTLPEGGTDFDFTGTGFPTDCDLDAFTLADDEQESCDNLVPSTYVVTESDVVGWDLTNIVCTGSADVQIGTDADFDLGDTSVTIDLGAGESASCTFTNEVQVPPLAIINLTKTPTDGAGHKITQAYVDDTITYIFEVENTSSADLINVTLTDDTGICDTGLVRGADKVGNNDNILEPGEVWVYTCSHLVTADDPDPLDNHAIVSGEDPQRMEVTDDDDASVDIVTGPKPVGGMAVPVNKAAIVAPWLGLIALSVAGISWFASRRREARS